MATEFKATTPEYSPNSPSWHDFQGPYVEDTPTFEDLSDSDLRWQHTDYAITWAPPTAYTFPYGGTPKRGNLEWYFLTKPEDCPYHRGDYTKEGKVSKEATIKARKMRRNLARKYSAMAYEEEEAEDDQEIQEMSKEEYLRSKKQIKKKRRIEDFLNAAYSFNYPF